MKKLIRRWLGIDKDIEDLYEKISLLIRAIDENFDLKKKDKSISKMMLMLEMGDCDGI